MKHDDKEKNKNVKEFVNRHDVLNHDKEEIGGCECIMINNVECHDSKRTISTKKKQNKTMSSKFKFLARTKIIELMK